MIRKLFLLLLTASIFGCTRADQTQVDQLTARVAKLEASVHELQNAARGRPAGAETQSTDRSAPDFPDEQTVAEWLKTGVGAPDFAIAAEGDAVRIESTVPGSKRYVALVRVAAADQYVGKHVSAEFEVRTEPLDNAACILKVQRERPLTYAGFVALDFVDAPPPSEHFVPCRLGVDVPNGAGWILFGLTYRGSGKAWVRAPKLEAK